MRSLTVTRDDAALVAAPAAAARRGRPRLLAVNPAAPHERFVLCADSGALACAAAGGWRWTLRLEPESGARGAGAWLALAYLAEAGALFAASRDGTMLKVHVAGGELAANGELPRVELLGQIEGGIAAAAWSADQARLLVVTGAAGLLVLSAQWDVLAEAPTPPFATCAAEGNDGGAVHAAWRPDGALIALSVWDDAAGRRALRLYRGDLTQPPAPTGSGAAVACAAVPAGHAAFVRGRNEDGTPVTGLHGPVAWSADGMLVACGQLVPARQRL